MGKNQIFVHNEASYLLDEAPVSSCDGILRADDYDDLYFSKNNGLAESEYVFIHGNDLIEKLNSSKQITIAETGFGAGLNFLAVLLLLNKFPNCQLDYISCESRPLTYDVMCKVHAIFPALTNISKEFLVNMPPRWPGMHLRHFFQGQVRLHLLYGDAETYLADADFHADVWFLDGFTPAKNPEIWSNSLLAHVGRLTRSGGSLSSFTAAGSVRRGLTKAGFTITKYPGFGQKRDMIKGKKIGKLLNNDGFDKVGIIGGGIAGASVAAGLRNRGINATILEAEQKLATKASGNRLAFQIPRLSVDHNYASQLSASCLSYAASISDKAGSTISRSVLSLDWPDREAIRQVKFRAQYWPNDLLRPVNKEEASARAGVLLQRRGVIHDYGRVITPTLFCNFLASATPQIFNAEIIRIERDDRTVNLQAKDGRQFVFDKVVLANGAGLPKSLQQMNIGGLRVDITSGQVNHLPEQSALAALKVGLSFGGYLSPSYEGFHELGATFDRNGCSSLDGSAFKRNLELLPPEVRQMLSKLDNCSGRISWRASTPDHNPVMGCIDDRIYVLGALGARGFTLAPLLGECLAAKIADMPTGLGRSFRIELDPFRFRLRRGLKS